MQVQTAMYWAARSSGHSSSMWNVTTSAAFFFHELDARPDTNLAEAAVSRRQSEGGDSCQRASRTAARQRLATLAGSDLLATRIGRGAAPAERCQETL